MNAHGNLFTAKQKKNDKQPDYRGSLWIDDVEYEIAGWTRESEKAGKYISLHVKDKYVQNESDGRESGNDKKSGFSETHDDLPF
jgi:uncharacterized protein (DUF736 family)